MNRIKQAFASVLGAVTLVTSLNAASIDDYTRKKSVGQTLEQLAKPKPAAPTERADLTAESNATTSRRRAVSRGVGDIGANYFVPIVGTNTLAITNHDSVDAQVKACQNSCIPRTIAPGQTVNYTVGDGLVQILSSSEKIEGRTRTLDMIPRSEAVRGLGSLPAYTGTHTITFATPRSTQIEVAELDASGILSGRVDVIDAKPGFTNYTITPSTNTKQFKLKTTEPVVAFMQTPEGAVLQAQDDDLAQGLYLILNATNTAGKTKVTFTNPVPTNGTGANMRFFSAEQEHRTTGLGGSFSIVNGGALTIDDAVAYSNGAGTGVISVEGLYKTPRPEDGRFTMHAWASNGGTAVATTSTNSGAVSALGTQTPTQYNAVISSVHPDDIIGMAQANETFDTVTGKIHGYTNGVKTSTTQVTFRGKENMYRKVSDIAPGADRVVMELDAPPEGSTLVPQAVMTSTNTLGFTHTAYRVERAARPQFTGQDYWNSQGAFLKEGQLNLNQDEAKFLLDNYADRLADIIVNSTPSTCTPDACADGWTRGAFTKENIASYLRQLVNCNTSDPELIRDVDPLIYANRPGTRTALSFYELPGGKAQLFYMNAGSMTSTFSVIKDAMETRSTLLPEQYGGSTSTGPNPAHPSTWHSQDRTNTTYCK